MARRVLSCGQRVDELDACAQEAYVVHPAVRGGLRAAPHACALDVDADVVAQRIALGQCDGVFALAAAQFQYDGVVVAHSGMLFRRTAGSAGR